MPAFPKLWPSLSCSSIDDVDRMWKAIYQEFYAVA